MAVLLLNEPRPICKGTFSSMENPAVASEFANSAGNVCVTSCKSGRASVPVCRYTARTTMR